MLRTLYASLLLALVSLPSVGAAQPYTSSTLAQPDAYAYTGIMGSPGATMHAGQLHVFYGMNEIFRDSWSGEYSSRAHTYFTVTGSGGTSTSSIGSYRQSWTALDEGNAVSQFFIRNTGLVGFNYDVLSRYRKVDGSQNWVLSTIDGGIEGDVVSGGALTHMSNAIKAVMYAGQPHVFYVGRSCGCMRHAWWDPSANRWNYEILDGEGGADGRISTELSTDFSAIDAVVAGNQIHLVYIDSTNSKVRHAFYTGAGWLFETIPSSRQYGQSVSVTMYGGDPLIVADDTTLHDLVSIRPNSIGGWIETVLDGDGAWHGLYLENKATDSAVGRARAMTYGGKLHVFYISVGKAKHMETDFSTFRYLELPSSVTGGASATLPVPYVDAAGKLNSVYANGPLLFNVRLD
ncbi:hypothetical protein [Corallococcus sp. AB045]|uniref:hypothetical protein n=1 Tax=Corallococcus sp. AB045 TaxID=2316719 RepID=UPI0011C3EF21|nr:hypothetical protein [Corallococcus sp. AB045]